MPTVARRLPLVGAALAALVGVVAAGARPLGGHRPRARGPGRVQHHPADSRHRAGRLRRPGPRRRAGRGDRDPRRRGTGLAGPGPRRGRPVRGRQQPAPVRGPRPLPLRRRRREHDRRRRQQGRPAAGRRRLAAHEHRHRHRPPGREPGCRAAERRGHVRERRRTGPGPHHPGVAAPHVVLRGAGRGGPRPDHRRARPRVPAARPSPPRTAAGHGGDGERRGPPGAPGRAQTPSGQQAGTSVPPQASGTGQVGRE